MFSLLLSDDNGNMVRDWTRTGHSVGKSHCLYGTTAISRAEPDGQGRTVINSRSGRLRLDGREKFLSERVMMC